MLVEKEIEHKVVHTLFAAVGKKSYPKTKWSIALSQDNFIQTNTVDRSVTTVKLLTTKILSWPVATIAYATELKVIQQWVQLSWRSKLKVIQ